MFDAATGHDANCSIDWVQAAAGAARITARRRRLTPTEAEDLRSEVWLKVLRNDGAVLKQFGGRGSLQSYLASVADRCLLDQRVRDLGKWRPSKRARVSGATAVLVERLTQRDGMSIDEAVKTIRSRGGIPEKALVAALSTIPPTRPQRRTCSLDEAFTLRSEGEGPEAQLESSRAARRANAIRAALMKGLSQLTDDDRHILRRRFVHGDSVADISRSEHRNQKPLYRRIERLLQLLRSDLASLGITAADAHAALGCAATPLEATTAQISNHRAPIRTFTA